MKFLALVLLLSVSQTHAMVLQGQGHGARQVGLGQAVTAGGAEGPYGIYYNAAQTVLAHGPEFSMDYAQLLMGLSDGSKLSQSFLGFVYPWKGTDKPPQAWGFAYSNFALQSLYREDVFYGSYASALPWRLYDGDFYVGGALKRISRTYGDQSSHVNAFNNFGQRTGRADPTFASGLSASAWSMDTGMVWAHQSGWNAGFQWTDLLEPNLALGAQPDRLRRAMHFAAAYQRKPGYSFVGELELKRRLTTVTDRRINLAAERTLPSLSFGTLAFRGGFGFGNRSWSDIFMGLSWKSNAIGIDYAFQLPFAVQSTMGNHRISLSVRFGEAAPEEEIATLYQKERKDRVRAEEDLDQALDELEKLLRYSEEKERQENVKATEQIPEKKLDAEEEERRAQRKRNSPPAEFWTSWKLYQDRVASGAGRGERMEILRRLMDAYGRWDPAKAEWETLRVQMEQDRVDFNYIWKSYQQLAAMEAPRSVLIQSLQRIVRRFEGSGLDMSMIYREIDRLR